MSIFDGIDKHPLAVELSSRIIRTDSELELALKDFREKHIVWTNGSFDLKHVGHDLLLHQASSLGDILIVGVNSDSSVRSYKPVKGGIRRPIVPEFARALSVLCVKGVDYVLLFDEPSPEKYIHMIRPSVWVRGETYDCNSNMRMEDHPEGQAVLKYGGKCIKLPLAGNVSTTAYLENLRSRISQ